MITRWCGRALSLSVKTASIQRARILQKMSLQTNTARDKAVLHLPALGNVWRRLK